MKFYKIVEEDKPVAVVFHDYLTGVVICRSRYESFFKAFEEIRNVGLTKVSKEVVEGAPVARLVSVSQTDFSYAETLLNIVCGGFWRIAGEGECLNSEEEVDQVVGQFLVGESS